MFKPINGRVLIKPDASELQKKAQAAGLVLSAEADREKPITGTIVVGGKETEAGQRVLFSKFAFDEVRIDEELYYVVFENAVLGIF